VELHWSTRKLLNDGKVNTHTGDGNLLETVLNIIIELESMFLDNLVVDSFDGFSGRSRTIEDSE
jgi:hypothetical protein